MIRVFRSSSRHSGWLDDYALFVAVKEANGGKPWYEWEPELVARKPAALARWRDKLAAEHPLPPVRPVRLRDPDAGPAQDGARRRG